MPTNKTFSQTVEEALLKCTADLMAGLEQSHFPREQQTKIFTSAISAITEAHKKDLEKIKDELNDVYYQNSMNEDN